MMMQLDPQLSRLLNNSVKLNHRSFIALATDKGQERIPNLYQLHFLFS